MKANTDAAPLTRGLLVFGTTKRGKTPRAGLFASSDRVKAKRAATAAGLTAIDLPGERLKPVVGQLRRDASTTMKNYACRQSHQRCSYA